LTNDDTDAKPTKAASVGDDTVGVPDGDQTQAVETAATPSENEIESAHAWSLDHGEEPGVESKWRSRLLWAGLVGLLCATVAAVVWFSTVFYFQGRSTSKTATPGTSVPTAQAPIPASAPPTPPSPSAATPPPNPVEPTTTTTTTPEVSKSGFYGEWGQHSTSVTLAPDGSAHYAVWLGVSNGTSWSATWSAMTSTTAMIVLTTQLDSHGDTASEWLDRYSGQAFTFTLRPDGYATITAPSGQPITLCPRGTGFHDTKGLCGA
jgi:serine/threonine protein kinase, bacterial